MPRRIGQEPVQHGSERCDTRAGRDKDSVARGRAQDEVTKRSLTADFLTLFHVAEKVRHKAILHAIQAECEAVVVSWRGSDGVSTGDFFAICFVGLKGQPLPGDETKSRHTR